MEDLSLDSIRRAAGTIAGKVHRTPLLSSRTLGRDLAVQRALA